MDKIEIQISDLYKRELDNDDVEFFKWLEVWPPFDWRGITSYAALYGKRKCLKFFIKSKKLFDFDIYKYAILGNTLNYFIGKKVVESFGHSPKWQFAGIWAHYIELAISKHKNKYLSFLIKYCLDPHNYKYWYIEAVKAENYKAISILKCYFPFSNECVKFAKSETMILHLYQHGARFRQSHAELAPKFFYFIKPNILKNLNIKTVDIFQSWQYKTSYKTRQKLFIKIVDYFLREKVIHMYPIKDYSRCLINFPIKDPLIEGAAYYVFRSTFILRNMSFLKHLD